VNVASAGPTMSELAELCTLLDIAANGRLTTNTALPSTVAMKHAGRTTKVSTVMAAGSGVEAFADVAARPKASAHSRLNDLVFMRFFNWLMNRLVFRTSPNITLDVATLQLGSGGDGRGERRDGVA
jgi:hypothetical protein